jgi:hypothetical protein
MLAAVWANKRFGNKGEDMADAMVALSVAFERALSKDVSVTLTAGCLLAYGTIRILTVTIEKQGGWGRMVGLICLFAYNFAPAYVFYHVHLARKHIRPEWLDKTPNWTFAVQTAIQWALPAVAGMLCAFVWQSRRGSGKKQ